MYFFSFHFIFFLRCYSLARGNRALRRWNKIKIKSFSEQGGGERENKIKRRENEKCLLIRDRVSKQNELNGRESIQLNTEYTINLHRRYESQLFAWPTLQHQLQSTKIVLTPTVENKKRKKNTNLNKSKLMKRFERQLRERPCCILPVGVSRASVLSRKPNSVERKKTKTA